MKKEQGLKQEEQLDHQIQLCKQELGLLMDNQENWQYPLCSVCASVTVMCVFVSVSPVPQKDALDHSLTD